MIRRSPAEFYLKYLVVHPDKNTNDQIVQLCERKQLDVIGEWYLDKLRDSCTPPQPFYPLDTLHIKSQRFLFKEKIQQLFTLDKEMKQALEILEKPRVKEFVEAMVLSGAPIELIASALGPHRGFHCSSTTIQLYRHFFWNVDLVDSTELRALLQMRSPHPDFVGSDQKKMAAAMHKMQKEDPRVVAAHLPNSPLVALMSQMRMGLMPKNLNLGDVVEVTRKMAALRALEAVSRDDAFASKRALEYTMVAKSMTEMLEMIVRPDERLRAELSTIALRTDENTIPHIDVLSQGKHTVELAPRMEPNEPIGDPGDSEDVA